MRSPTIKDVARLAGVGVGTVSRVLNGSAQVRAETRDKVLVAIQELGFEPNLAARQLSGGKTFTIGVVTPFFTFPSFVERVMGIQDVLDASPYDLVLYSVRSPERLRQQMRIIINQNRVDGLIVLSLRIDERELQVIRADFPVVLIVDDVGFDSYPYAVIENFKGGLLATNYLLHRGHTAIGFIGDPVDNAFGFTSTRERFEGYKHALAEAGLPLREDWCRFAEYTQESARENARQILSLPDRPTALFVSVDTLALGVLAASHDLGLRVPQDIAIIGFDDIEAASYIQLTTVRQPLIESGRWAARKLLNWLQSEGKTIKPDRHEFDLKIVERSTV